MRALRRSRFLQGCYYFGCFMPLGFAVIFLMGIGNRLRKGSAR